MTLNVTVQDIGGMNELELESLRLEILEYLSRSNDPQMMLLLNEVDQRLLELEGDHE